MFFWFCETLWVAVFKLWAKDKPEAQELHLNMCGVQDLGFPPPTIVGYLDETKDNFKIKCYFHFLFRRWFKVIVKLKCHYMLVLKVSI